MAKGAYPIPEPNKCPGAIYRTKRSDVWTLQEQMLLEDDPETFSELMDLMKQATANHVDIKTAYRWQDPQLLENIREEVLAQWPILEEMYVDAWPITYYLRWALKHRGIPRPDHTHTVGQKLKRKPPQSKSNRDTVLGKMSMASKNSLASKAASGGGEQGKSLSVVPSSKRPPHHSSRLTKKKEVIDLTRDKPAREKSVNDGDEVPEDEAGEGEMCSVSHNSGNTECSDPDSDTEGSPPLCLSRGSFNYDYTSITREDNCQRAHESQPRSRLQSPQHALHRRRIPSPELDPSDTSSALVTGRSNEAIPGTGYTTVDSSSSGSQTYVRPPLVIEAMLLARGIPMADAKCIARLLSSLGVVNRTYLHVFAHLAPSRQAWLSEMRQTGQLSEIQAWVVVDMLDTTMMDDD